MTGTFTPMPGAASLPRMVVTQARMESRLMLRNGEQLLIAVVIPVIVLVGMVSAADSLGLDYDHPVVDVITPGVLALAVLSTSFTSLAIATGFERRYGVLKRLGTSPLPRSGLLAGKILALLMVEALQIAVISARRAPARLVAVPRRGRGRRRGPRRGCSAPRRSPRSVSSSRAPCAPRRPWPWPTSSTCSCSRAAP